MAIRKTTEQVIDEFTQVHGSKYNYDQVEYINASTKVKILCSTHGIFLQQPRAHLAGQGCPKCTQSKNWAPNRNTKEFICRAKQVHGDKYDYSNTLYIKSSEQVFIICPQHGQFKQLANSHLNGRGCPKCARNIKKSTGEFIEQAILVHGEVYDYSDTEYINTNQKITIICKKHGRFDQQPASHLYGQGCPKCGIESMKSAHRKDCDQFILECKAVHGNKYDYSSVRYTSRAHKIIIICPKHGKFKQKASEHLRGYGCSKCAGNKLLTTEEFISRAKEVHADTYGYDNTEYNGSKNHVSITCKKHGIVSVSAGWHLAGGGCHQCCVSREQREVYEFVSQFCEAQQNDRSAISPLELDIFIPSIQLAIEYNGNYWHSFDRIETTQMRKRHAIKLDIALSNNINLMQIPSHCWKNKRNIIESMIKHRLGISEKIGARKCTPIALNSHDSVEFFKRCHVGGYKNASLYFGLTFNGKIVSAMSMANHREHWEIARYACELGTTIVGGFSKMLSMFTKTHNPKSIITYSDRMYGSGSVYLKSGFKSCGRTRPGYIYLDSNCNPAGSRIKFQKHKLPRLLGDAFDPELTEAENMFKSGYRRLWDAGHNKFIWHNSSMLSN